MPEKTMSIQEKIDLLNAAPENAARITGSEWVKILPLQIFDCWLLVEKSCGKIEKNRMKQRSLQTFPLPLVFCSPQAKRCA